MVCGQGLQLQLLLLKMFWAGEELMNISRTPEIMADAAYEIFTKDPSSFYR